MIKLFIFIGDNLIMFFIIAVLFLNVAMKVIEKFDL